MFFQLRTSICKMMILPRVIFLLVLAIMMGRWQLVAAPRDLTEPELVSRLQFYVNDIKSSMQIKLQAQDAADPLHKAEHKQNIYVTNEECPSVNMLGWTIIAAGEHYQGSDALKEVMFKIKNDIGFLAPSYWVNWEEGRNKIVASYMHDVLTSDEDNPYVATHLYWLADEAMVRITARSGYKFEGYKGIELITKP